MKTVPPLGRSQRGTVLLLTLIILVVLMASGVAVVRSFDTTQFAAGNLAFKRDLLNRAERAVPRILTSFQTGTMSAAAARESVEEAFNYSPITLASNPQGVPQALLLDDPAFDGLNFAQLANDFDAGDGVTIRYMVDRMCRDDPTAPTLQARCNVVSQAPSGSDVVGGGLPPPVQIVYRISIRVIGPRNTEAFIQSTFTL